jgi:hypothetical protein
MAISIQSSRDNADDKTVFFTIGYKGTDYKWHGDMPKDAEAQDYLDAKSDTLKVGLLRKQYFDAVVPQLQDKSALESFEAVVLPHQNIVYEVIPLLMYQTLHPDNPVLQHPLAYHHAIYNQYPYIR